MPTLVAGRGELRPRRGVGRDVAAAFRAIAKTCDRVLDLADAPLVEAAAVMLARALAAGRDVEARGMLVEVVRIGRDGERSVRREPNPCVRLEREAWSEFRRLAAELGIGPAARARLAGLGVEGRGADEEMDELAALRAARSVPEGDGGGS